jgi:hypothetical protein
MITKTLIAAAAVALTAAAVAAPAQAKVNVYLGLGGYGPEYYEPAYPVYVEPRHHHQPVYEEEYVPRRVQYGVSCEDGVQALRYNGFHKVRALDCSGKRFKYKARRDGSTYVVRVSSRSGNIVSVEETY